MPCYNPGEGWWRELLAFYQLTGSKYQLGFVVVNDGSQNLPAIREAVNSLEMAAVPVRLISYQKNMGKGYALRRGVAEARAEYILYTDIDFPFTDSSMLRTIEVLVSGETDIAIGYRASSYYQEKMTAWRRLLSRSFRFFIRRVLKMKVTDTQCGLKGFNKRGRDQFLATTINRYLFDFEFIYHAGRDTSLRLKTVEVQLKENIVFSRMRVKVLLQELMNLTRVLLFPKRQVH